MKKQYGFKWEHVMRYLHTKPIPKNVDLELVVSGSVVLSRFRGRDQYLERRRQNKKINWRRSRRLPTLLAEPSLSLLSTTGTCSTRLRHTGQWELGSGGEQSRSWQAAQTARSEIWIFITSLYGEIPEKSLFNMLKNQLWCELWVQGTTHIINMITSVNDLLEFNNSLTAYNNYYTIHYG